MFNILYEQFFKKINNSLFKYFSFILVFIAIMFSFNLLTLDLSYLQNSKYITIFKENHSNIMQINYFVIKIIGLFTIFYYTKLGFIYIKFILQNIITNSNNKFTLSYAIKNYNLLIFLKITYTLARYEAIFLIFYYLSIKTNIISIDIYNINYYLQISINYIVINYYSFKIIQLVPFIFGIATIISAIYHTYIKDLIK